MGRRHPPRALGPRLRTVRRGDRSRRPPRGQVLLKALPPGRVASSTARGVRTRRAAHPRTVRALRRPDARRTATRSPLLLQTLPPGRIPRPPRLPTSLRLSDTSRDTSLSPTFTPAVPSSLGKASSSPVPAARQRRRLLEEDEPRPYVGRTPIRATATPSASATAMTELSQPRRSA
jgi:hypothetical protein